MADHPLQSYALALINLMEEQEDVVSNPPLGTARRLGSQISTFDVPAHKLPQSLIRYSPSPEALARRFFVELSKCQIAIAKSLIDALGNDRTIIPDDWASIMYQELRQFRGNMMPLTDLASLYLSHLIIAFRNPGGKKTPQDSIYTTPHPKRIEDIDALLKSVTVRQSQSALRDVVRLRDGDHCPLTGYTLFDPGALKPRCVHIIPQSVCTKTHVHHAIETFTGQTLSAEHVQQLTNHPANAITIESNPYDSMDQKLAWGIECRLVNDKWKYYFRAVRPDDVPFTVTLDDGDEIRFGRGIGGDAVEPPDPRICNLHLAVARVFAASGAAEVFDKYLDDDYMVMWART